MATKPGTTPGPMITVRCTTAACEMHDREQAVPAGVSLSATVLLTGTLSCTVCGNPLEPVAGDRTARA